ncbi:hypothetical protein CRG98_014171 [Punica granatum]|uniref:Uncharacterized protein n=1 Tax=Punica granatum TaxID=22663 RepID=A0A2I0KA62_PUNGR|nr:hypothetical protein CRG98_014171 [Punica granatum]
MCRPNTKGFKTVNLIPLPKTGVNKERKRGGGGGRGKIKRAGKEECEVLDWRVSIDGSRRSFIPVYLSLSFLFFRSSATGRRASSRPPLPFRSRGRPLLDLLLLIRQAAEAPLYLFSPSRLSVCLSRTLSSTTVFIGPLSQSVPAAKAQFGPSQPLLPRARFSISSRFSNIKSILRRSVNRSHPVRPSS